MTQPLLILCSLLVLCATVRAQAKVRCANSVQEYEDRIRQQRQAVQAEAKGMQQTSRIQPVSAEAIRELVQAQINRQISTRELDLKVAVSIYAKNPDYLQIDLDARSIPISVPDGEAKVTIEFRRSGDSINETYSIPVCTGKLNKAYKQKPPQVIAMRLDSFVASSVTYTVPNIKILVHVDDPRSPDLVGEVGAREEEAKRIKQMAEAAYAEQLSANVPECQIDRNWIAEDLVSRSDAIVLARARRPMGRARSAVENQVEFEIMQVVKGNYSAPTLALSGTFVGSKVLRRDYVDCVPVTYAAGQEYLLFLKRVGEKMDLLWYPTARVNDPVANKNDRWFKEVGRISLRPKPEDRP